MRKTIALSIALLLGLTAAAHAVPTIVVGSHLLNANQAGQIVQLFVTGGDNVLAMDLNVQIGDGGPGVGGVDITPTLTGDIITGTIFATNNTGQNDPGGYGNQALYVSTTTATGSVVANGLIATLVIDTTGFNSTQSWVLSVSGTANGDTDFPRAGGSFAQLTNGDIHIIVPEPASVVLGLFAAAAVGMIAIRKRRATA